VGRAHILSDSNKVDDLVYREKENAGRVPEASQPFRNQETSHIPKSTSGKAGAVLSKQEFFHFQSSTAIGGVINPW
jgi:hypothetical protein